MVGVNFLKKFSKIFNNWSSFFGQFVFDNNNWSSFKESIGDTLIVLSHYRLNFLKNKVINCYS